MNNLKALVGILQHKSQGFWRYLVSSTAENSTPLKKKKKAYALLFRPKRDGGHMGDWHEPRKSMQFFKKAKECVCIQ